jgi:hypothetical protein
MELEDLNDLVLWFQVTQNKMVPLIFSMVFGISASIILRIVNRGTLQIPLFLGSTFFLAVSGFFTGIIIYYIPLIFLLPVRLSRYHFKLFAANPSRSEIIDQISGMVNAFVYISAVYSAVATVVASTSGRLASEQIFYLIVLTWLPIIGLFVVNQFALNRIITNAKWKTLNEIQARIDELQDIDKLTSNENMAIINFLLDYHERIASTPNLALKFRDSFGFFNSLLFPLLAFLASNFDKVLEYIFK